MYSSCWAKSSTSGYIPSMAKLARIPATCLRRSSLEAFMLCLTRIVINKGDCTSRLAVMVERENIVCWHMIARVCEATLTEISLLIDPLTLSLRNGFRPKFFFHGVFHRFTEMVATIARNGLLPFYLKCANDLIAFRAMFFPDAS